MIMLNLGAGLQQRPGWINYDRSRVVLIRRNRLLRWLAAHASRMGFGQMLAWPSSTRVADLTRGIPHATDSVDVIYSSHMLEHVHEAAARALLTECYRVLKPEGILRVVVPDLRLAAQSYLDRDTAFFSQPANFPIADAFVESLHLRARPKGGQFERLVRWLLRTDEGGHRWMYDGESMCYRIAQAGFRDVSVCGYREGRCQDAVMMDSRPVDSVHIEATK